MRSFVRQRYTTSHITMRNAIGFVFVIDNDIVLR
jgi:hypothetical protein